MGFSKQEYYPFPSPGALSDLGTEPGSPALQADSLPSEPPGKPQNHHMVQQFDFWAHVQRKALFRRIHAAHAWHQRLPQPRTWKQPKCPLTGKRVKNEWYRYRQWAITLPLARMKCHLQLQVITLSDVRQKDNYHTIWFICRIQKTAQMNLIIKQKQAHRLREGTYGYQQGRVSGGIDWEFGVDMYTRLYLK